MISCRKCEQVCSVATLGVANNWASHYRRLLRAFSPHQDERYRVVLTGPQFKQYAAPDVCLDLSSRVPGAKLVFVNGLGAKPDPFSAGSICSHATFSFHAEYDGVKVLRHASLPRGIVEAMEAAANSQDSEAEGPDPPVPEAAPEPDKQPVKPRKTKAKGDNKRRRAAATSSKVTSDDAGSEETESEPDSKLGVAKVKKEKKPVSARTTKGKGSSAPSSRGPTPEPKKPKQKKRPRSVVPDDEHDVPASRDPSPPPLRPFDPVAIREPELGDDVHLFSRKLRLMSVQQLNTLLLKLAKLQTTVIEEINDRYNGSM